ncbi:MAG: hypothetical protein L0Y35_00215, partial [Flammeovirgaceae bacterium]|nr:hypothetical protein [Flammeovirgaceae bacterium]
MNIPIDKQSCVSSPRLFIFLLFISSIQTKAQQALNLDFEKKSIEGISRPWGWDFMTDSETNVSLDSVVKSHGEYSLKMDATLRTGEQVLAFTLEPYELQHKTLVIEGWIKTSELIGEASYSLLCISNKDTVETTSKSINNSTDWVRLSVNAKLPDKITSIYLTVRHEGTGTAWFDNFSLLVNDKRKQELEISLPFTKKQLEWLNNNSYPLVSVDVSDSNTQSNDDDLNAFKSLVGNARIIALGESTHGTSEFFRLKHRVLEYCIRNLGVRLFAIEDHQLVVKRVNQYVLGGKGTARSSMYGMLG